MNTFLWLNIRQKLRQDSANVEVVVAQAILIGKLFTWNGKSKETNAGNVANGWKGYFWWMFWLLRRFKRLWYRFDHSIRSGFAQIPFYSSSCFVLNESKCKRYIRQICSGLNYIHKNHILHLDVKPFSVVFASVDDDSDLRITDFGLARRLGTNTMKRILPCQMKMLFVTDMICGILYSF